MRVIISIIGVLAVVILALNLDGFYSPAKTKIDDQLLTVKVRYDSIRETVSAIGTVKPKVGAEVKVGSQVSGVVTHLYVNVGDSVKKGELLAQVDDSLVRAKLATQTAEKEITIHEVDFNKAELARYEPLKSFVTKSKLDEIRKNLEVGKATIKKMDAMIADLTIQLGFTKILAPISGKIASVSTYEGETVAASFAAPTFVTIVDSSRVEVQALVDETDIAKVALEQTVQLKLDAYPAAELTGKVKAIYPKPQLINNIVNYQVIIDIDDLNSINVRPEMTVRVGFNLVLSNNTLMIPRSALLTESEKSYVVMRTEKGLERKIVVIGAITSSDVQILSGVQQDNEVLMDAKSWLTYKEQGSRHD